MTEAKKYNLKKSEVMLIEFIQRKASEMVSMVVSHIANDRLSYPLTQNTQFNLDLEHSEISISELEPAKPKEEIVKTAK